jgi:lysylphosphatidylglycerol synthase-like protein
MHGVSELGNALTGASAGWLALGVLLHLANQAVRGRGWFAVVRAASPDDGALRRRDAILAWVAGAGAGGVVSARGGDVVRVLLLGRRADGTRNSVLTGTLVAEAAGDAIVGAAVIALAVALGAAPAFGLPGGETLAIAGGVLALLAVVALVVRRRGGRAAGIAAGIGRGCAPLGRPLTFARTVLPWQAGSRALRAAAIACFLMAFSLPAGAAAVLLVMLAQSGGRLLPLAPASAAASVAMLAAGFGPATGTHVAAADVAAFMIGMSLLLTLAGAVLAVAVICAGADRAAVWRALRPRRRAAAAAAPNEA